MKKRFGLFLLLFPSLLAALLGLLWMLGAVFGASDRGRNLAVSFDQLANTAFGGDVDETISSRAGKAARKGKPWACVLCKALAWFDPDHCEKSIEPDRGKSLT